MFNKQCESMTGLLEAMYNQFTSNSPTTDYRADLAVDFISLITALETAGSTDFLWMEREQGTCLLGSEYAMHEVFTNWLSVDKKQRYHRIDTNDNTLVQIEYNDVVRILDQWGFDFEIEAS